MYKSEKEIQMFGIPRILDTSQALLPWINKCINMCNMRHLILEKRACFTCVNKSGQTQLYIHSKEALVRLG